MKKIHYLLLILFFFTIMAPTVFAVGDYQPLVTIPGVTSDTKTVTFSDYVSGAYTFAIGFSLALAVIMLVIAGFQYMSSEAFTSKEDAKKRIWAALVGILIIISAYLLLNTINPDLINFKLNLTLPVDNSTSNPIKPVYPLCKNDPHPVALGIYMQYRDRVICDNAGSPFNAIHFKSYESSDAGLAQCKLEAASGIYWQANCIDLRAKLTQDYPTVPGWYVKFQSTIGGGSTAQNYIRYFGPFADKITCDQKRDELWSPAGGTTAECINIGNTTGAQYCIDIFTDSGRFYKSACYAKSQDCDAAKPYWSNINDAVYFPANFTCTQTGNQQCINLQVIGGDGSHTAIQPPDCFEKDAAGSTSVCDAKIHYWTGKSVRFHTSGDCHPWQPGPQQ